LVSSVSQTQWQEILRAVHDGCEFPSHFEPEALLKAANAYLEDISSYKPPSRGRPLWRAAAVLLGKASASIRKADPHGWATVHLSSVAEVPSHFTVPDVLDKWQGVAETLAETWFEGLHPRSDFFREVLDVWFMAGGPFAFSRNSPESSSPGQLSGPTVRFLQSVLGPVMESRAPKPEGIRNIIERYAQWFELLLSKEPEYATFIRAHRSAARREAGKTESKKAAEASETATRKKQGPMNRALARRVVRGR
jgi:hypothetical protein